MSIELRLIPTVSGQKRAMNYSETGFAIKAKYLCVGSGLQTIVMDDAGRAITDALKQPVACLEILAARKVDDYQHQLITDLVGVRDTEWNFSEVLVADEDMQPIAIYGHSTQKLLTVTPVLNKALLNANLLLGTFPAGSVNIVHQGFPLELYNVRDMIGYSQSIMSMCVSDMKDFLAREKADKKRAEALQKRIAKEVLQQQQIEANHTLINQLQEQMKNVLSGLANQEVFNTNMAVNVMASANVDMQHFMNQE